MKNDFSKYCSSMTKYSRFVTREVRIGDVSLGGSFPIRIQSMTTTDTMDTKSTVKQTIRMIEAGCEYVRITAPSLREAENLKNIKNELINRGYRVPLIADIHFTPNAAEIAARIVEKVRINPGNYADKKKFQKIEYTDDDYAAEIERISKKFVPLVETCKEYGTAMRIGTNHGSLSDRILSRYGDTPRGMVESALEFVRICEDRGYYDIVLSMKASNTQVMVQAYRLLIQKMIEEGMNYPLHIGVTEAGDGEDGRIKSAVGIGALLEDGIGDTVRVSLTEPPENEIPVAKILVDRYSNRKNHKSIVPIEKIPKDPVSYEKRESFSIGNIGGKNVPVVIADFSDTNINSEKAFIPIGYNYSVDYDKWNLGETAADYLFIGNGELPINPPSNLKLIVDYSKWKKENNRKVYPIFMFEEFIGSEIKSDDVNFVIINADDVFNPEFKLLGNNKSVVLILRTDNLHGMAEQRRVFFELIQKEINNPVIVKREYKNISTEEMILYSSTDIGGLLIDGFGDGVWINYTNEKNRNLLETVNKTQFGILQAARQRISKTEYIACPSCGRTLFDLVKVTNKIRERTAHLKGIKIGIMGCIVNGPGEMADADYGYVGVGIGKINLYRGREVVRKNVSEELAVNELINIIAEDGNWIDKSD